MVGGSILGTGVGVIFLTQLSLAQFQLWIGLIVIVLCVFLSRYRPKSHLSGPGVAAGTGTLSGLMNGAFAIPGPPVIVYAMACIPEPAKSRGFLMAFFMISSLISLTTFTVSGLVTDSAVLPIVAVNAGNAVGRSIGNLVVCSNRWSSVSTRSPSLILGSGFGNYFKSTARHGIYCLTLSRTIRALWRSQSLAFSVSRLSCCFLPAASAIFALAKWPFQYKAVQTQVCPF